MSGHLGRFTNCAYQAYYRNLRRNLGYTQYNERYYLQLHSQSTRSTSGPLFEVELHNYNRYPSLVWKIDNYHPEVVKYSGRQQLTRQSGNYEVNTMIKLFKYYVDQIGIKDVYYQPWKKRWPTNKKRNFLEQVIKKRIVKVHTPLIETRTDYPIY